MFIQEKCIEEGMECSFKEVQLKRWEGGGPILRSVNRREGVESPFKICGLKRRGGVFI